MTKYEIKSDMERLDSEGALAVTCKKMPDRIKYDQNFKQPYNQIEKIISEMAEKGLIKKANLKITFETD